MLLLKLLQQLIKALNSEGTPGQVAAGIALGLGPAAIARALGGVAAVPGRFERVDAGQDFLVVVDYAHTPDALRRVLEAAGHEVSVTHRYGNVWMGILEEVESFQPGLLVLGRRGVGGLERLLGSVSEHVVRHVKVPVLLVP